MISLLDSEVLAALWMQDELNAKHMGQARDLEMIHQEIIDRFRVGCFGRQREGQPWEFSWHQFDSKPKGRWYAFDVSLSEHYMTDGSIGYEPQINAVLHERDDEGFDHERMAYEVKHDILEIDEPGKITADGRLVDP